MIGRNGHEYLAGAADVAGGIDRGLCPRDIKIAGAIDGDGTEILADCHGTAAIGIEWRSINDVGATGAGRSLTECLPILQLNWNGAVVSVGKAHDDNSVIVTIGVCASNDFSRGVDQGGMCDVDATVRIGNDTRDNSVWLDLLRWKRAESNAVLGACDLDDVSADLAQILVAGSDTLADLINRLIQRAAILRIAKSRDPRPVYAHSVGRVAGGEEGGPLVRTDAVAHIGKALQVGEVEAVDAVHCQG